MKTLVWLSFGFLVFAGVSMGGQMGVTGASVPENTVSNFIYVNNQSIYASDTNSGTNASLPLKTISKALNIATANNTNGIGTKIIIYPGIYRESVNMWSSANVTTAPIIFEAKSNGTAVISGSDIWTNWQQSANLYTHAWTNTWGFVPEPSSWTNYVTVAPISQRREIIFINGILVTQVLNLAAMQANTFFVDDTNAATVYVWPPNGINLSDPSTNVVEVGQRQTLFQATGKSCLVLKGLTLIHNTAVCWSGSGGFGNCTNVLMESCQFLWNNGGGSLSFGSCQNITVSNCVADYNGGNGYNGGNFMKNVLFVDNDFSYNNWRGAMGGFYGWSQAGAKNASTHDGVFRRQSFVGNQCHGLWFDTDNTNILVDSCFISENLCDGIDIEASAGPIVMTNNVICYNHTGSGVDTISSGQITLNNNTIYGNGDMYTNAGVPMSQVMVMGDSGRLVVNWETGVTNASPVTHFTLADNILVATDARQLVFNPSLSTGAVIQLFYSTFAFNRNHMWYNNPVNDKVFKVDESWNFYNFTNWQAQTGFGSDSACLPMTSITSPTNNAVVIITTNLANMTIKATAFDSDGGSDGGTISNVAFYNGTTLLGRDTTPPTPYSIVWSNIVSGSYVLRAVALDDYVPGDSRTSAPVNVQVWSDMHIGSNAGDSATGYGMTTYTLNGNGAGIGTNADDCRFLYMPMSGSYSMRARVVGCSSTSSLVRVGIMMRESTNANALEVSTLFAPQSNWMHFNSRTNTGGDTHTQGVVAAALPYWVMLSRSGTPHTNYNVCPWMSADGTNWVRVGLGQPFLNWDYTNVLLGGLVVTSGSTNGTISATFDNVTVDGNTTNGKSWSEMHVGSSTGDSAASYGPTYTVNGGGAGIGTNADAFRFVYVPTTGSYSIMARVVSCSGTAALARAGIMMRESTNANAIEVSTLFAPQSDWMHFYKRTTTGGNTGTQGVSAAALPYWVKLVRGGIPGTNYNVSPWMSTNGTTWVRVGGGQQFLNWSDTNSLLTGLAVASGSTNGTITATFDNVSIIPGGL